MATHMVQPVWVGTGKIKFILVVIQQDGRENHACVYDTVAQAEAAWTASRVPHVVRVAQPQHGYAAREVSGLSATQLLVLMAACRDTLADADDAESDLAERLGIQPRDVGDAFDSLQERRLIYRVSDPGHPNHGLICGTRAGMDCVANVSRFVPPAA